MAAIIPLHRPVSQLNSIQRERFYSLFRKKSTSYHYVARHVQNYFMHLHTFEVDPHDMEASDVPGSMLS